jgi:hypothetical protein
MGLRKFQSQHLHGESFALLLLLLLAVVVPFARAAEVTEDFSTDPAARGWEIFGDAGLLQWDAAAQNLRATWDSTKPNSYFRLPLGTVLNRLDDFSIAFDLRLEDITAGIVPGKPSTFPLAIGLQNHAQAGLTNFVRSTGANSPNLVEFNFFPDTGYGPTVWPAIWSTNSSLTYRDATDYTILDLPVETTLRITMAYSAADSTLVTTLTADGTPAVAIHPVTLSATFTDFRVDAFSVTSYSANGEKSKFGSSLLAHGTVDNVTLTLPPPPVVNLRGRFNGAQWEATFTSRTNWSYVLEAAGDFRSWSEVSPAANGTGNELALQETNAPPATMRFYRIKARHLP